MANRVLMAQDGRTNYLPIPSLKNRYEINIKGYVRNAKTKRRLKLEESHGRQYVSVVIDRRKRKIRVDSLMWEVHGVMPAPLKMRSLPVLVGRPFCPAQKFSSRKDAMRYLIKHGVPFSQSVIMKMFKAGASTIYGWEIRYLED